MVSYCLVQCFIYLELIPSTCPHMVCTDASNSRSLTRIIPAFALKLPPLGISPAVSDSHIHPHSTDIHYHSLHHRYPACGNLPTSFSAPPIPSVSSTPLWRIDWFMRLSMGVTKSVLGSCVCVALEISSVTIHISNHRGPFSRGSALADDWIAPIAVPTILGAQRYDRSRHECAQR